MHSRADLIPWRQSIAPSLHLCEPGNTMIHPTIAGSITLAGAADLYHNLETGWRHRSTFPCCSWAYLHSGCGRIDETEPTVKGLKVSSMVCHGVWLLLTCVGSMERQHGKTSYSTPLWQPNGNFTYTFQILLEQITDALISGKAKCMGHFQIRAVLVHRLSRAALATDCFVDLMVTPGNTGDHSSFCSKAAGQYGLLLTLWSFMEECLVSKVTIMVACNGQSILDCLCSHKPIYPFAAHAHHLCTC